jgi:histidine phosphotransferase ChpT
MPESVVLMHLMIAKLCHDLATPLGALGLGLEMALENVDEKAIDKDTQDLLLNSSNTAKLRLKTYRALLSIGPESPTFSETQEALNLMCQEQKIRLNWHIGSSLVPNGLFCRVLLGLGFIAAESLIRGGAMSLYLKPVADDNIDIAIAAEGPMVQLRPGYMEALSNDQALLHQTSRTILPYYVRILASQYKKNITCHISGGNKLELVAA